MTETVGKTTLASVSLGSPFSFELKGDHLIQRFLGLIPTGKVHLGAINYLRLATRNEMSPFYFLLNWPQMLLSSHRCTRPVYVVQTRKGNKLFLKMEGGEHFRLRQAIARHSDKRSHKMAA